MGKEIVCDGAKLKCSMGSAALTLKVGPPSNSTVFVENKKVATKMDFIPMMSIPSPPGPPSCKSKTHPIYLSTMAAGAPVSPQPCMPITVPWNPFSKAVKVDMLGFEALHKGSKCKCAFGNGDITITDPGQKSVKIN